MKYATKLSTSLALLALLGFSACGGGGSSSSTPAVSTATDVRVERGKVYDATVVDSSTPLQTATQKVNSNVYAFAKKPVYPVSARGGWIDVNNDGKKDLKDVNLDITLKSYSNVLTPVTTYIADANETVRESRLQGLKDRLNASGVGSDVNVTDDDLLGVPSRVQNFDFILVVNAIYKDMKENGGNLDSSDEDSVLSQFASIEGSGTTLETLEAAVLASLVGSGDASYIPESEIPDENVTTTTPDANSTSSAGVYIATSNETVKTIYKLFDSPLLLDSKVYMRTYRGLDAGVDIGMKVLSYDLSQFNADMNISDLPTNILYEQVGPNFTNARFNQRYYDIAEMNNQLYFATLPQNVDTLSQSSFIKYDLASMSELYHVKEDPVMGEHLNSTFDLARGWFLPFDSANYMGIVENNGIKVVDTSDGSSYKYGIYDYYGGAGGGDDFSLQTPAGTETGFFYAEGNSFKNISYLSDHTEYGSRSTHLDPQYKVNDIFADFNASYTGSKPYDGVGQTAPIVVDGEEIYVLTRITYDDDEGFEWGDLHLIVYGLDSVIKSTTLLEEATSLSNWNDGIWETYKYKDTLYFKYRHEQKNELCAYNLTTKSFTFRHAIENNYYFVDIPATTYIITGDTIIMPENIARAEADCTNNPRGFRCYDLAFKVMDISDGSVIKTVHHEDLDSLRDEDYDVRVRASLSDANAVYFFALKKTSTTVDNMIIKIDTPSNKVQKTRNRFDNKLTGVITNSN